MIKERRLHPRFNVEFPVVVSREGQSLGDAKAENISRGGLQFACGSDLAEAIVPDGQQATPAQSIMVTLGFPLRLASGKSADINVTCRVIGSRRVSNSEYHIGVEFMEFVGDCEDFLAAYTDERLRNP